jgi:hypothetical protein
MPGVSRSTSSAATTKKKSSGELNPYETIASNWYKNKPYGFDFHDRSSNGDVDKGVRIYLPISPENIQVVTHFATNVVTTLYGVIEEHSEVRYYDIVIRGTTGMVPQWVLPEDNTPTVSEQQGRTSFEGGSISLGGALPEVTNTISQLKNLGDNINDALKGGPDNHTGVNPSQSGYQAFHSLYKYFLKYKKDAAGIGTQGTDQRSTHPLQFLNYKDNIKYDCSPQSFTLTRSADNPMLYNYEISLRAYNLRNVDQIDNEADQLSKFGLGDIKSQGAFTKLSNAAGRAASVISAVF